MCQPCSMIVTCDNVYWSRNHENHTKIIEEMNLKEIGLAGKVEIVRIEVTPPNDDFTKPLDQWVFKTDQTDDMLPNWYDAEKAEAAVREKLPAWLSAKIVLPGQERENHNSGEIIACYGKIHNVRDSATIQDVWDSATIHNVWDSATIQDVRDSATIQDVRDFATIHNVWGSATIHNVRDSATIHNVRGSATIVTHINLFNLKIHHSAVVIDRSTIVPVVYTTKTEKTITNGE